MSHHRWMSHLTWLHASPQMSHESSHIKINESWLIPVISYGVTHMWHDSWLICHTIHGSFTGLMAHLHAFHLMCDSYVTRLMAHFQDAWLMYIHVISRFMTHLHSYHLRWGDSYVTRLMTHLQCCMQSRESAHKWVMTRKWVMHRHTYVKTHSCRLGRDDSISMRALIQYMRHRISQLMWTRMSEWVI